MFRPVGGNKKTNAQLEQELTCQLGTGPMRFGPVRQEESSVQVQAKVNGLSSSDILAFAGIKAVWEMEYPKEAKRKGYTNNQILRIVIFSNFQKRRAIHLLRRSKRRLFDLSAIELDQQLRSQTIFPCPGLKTREGSNNVFYMRPSRYNPKDIPVQDVIDNLVFVMDKMISQNPKQGLAFLANMEGWTMANFSTEYCRKFMYGLQGRIFPAKVELFLILNPPPWFGKIWAIMKPMLSETFRECVHMVDDDELAYFMNLDYEEYLPDEVRGGRVDTGRLVQHFVQFHQSLEGIIHPTQTRSRLLLRGGGLRGGDDRVANMLSVPRPKKQGRSPWWKWQLSQSLHGPSDHSSTSLMSETGPLSA